MNISSLLGTIRRKSLLAASVRPATRRPRLKVETLEQRDVPAVLPAPVLDPTLIRPISGGGEINPTEDAGETGNGYSAALAANPLNPLEVVTANIAYSDAAKTKTELFLSFTTNGGENQTLPVGLQIPFFLNGYNFGALSSQLGIDPEHSDFESGLLMPYTRISDPSITYDRFSNIFVTYNETDDDFTSGRTVLRKFSLANGNVVPVALDPDSDDGFKKVLHVWFNDFDQAFNPKVAVNNNRATFQDPSVAGAAGTQTDNFAVAQGAAGGGAGDVRVFVTWNTNTALPTSGLPNRNVVNTIVSDDGGLSFAAPIMNNNDGYGNGQATYSQPEIIFSPGRTGTAGSGGQMVTVFNDINAAGSNAIRTETRNFATGIPHVIEVVNDNGAGINDALEGDDISIPQDTIYNLNVPANQVGANRLTRVENLTIKLNIQHENLSELRIRLRSPTGVFYTLVRNRVDAAGDEFIPQQGIEGEFMGIAQEVLPIGTTFSDIAGRSIRDPNAEDPFIGIFRPEGEPGQTTLNDTFDNLAQNQIAGNWQLFITDFVEGNTGFIVDATLKLSQNFNSFGAAEVVTVANPDPVPAIGSVSGVDYPNKPLYSPGLGVGPGVSIAVDNSLGAFSTSQNRMYIAYSTGSTVYVQYSDNNGLAWSRPSAVGAGFMPQITVDASTGTVVVAYMSPQYDEAGARSAAMIATSINAPAFGNLNSRLEWSVGTHVNGVEQYFDQITTSIKDFEPITSNPQVAGFGSESYGNSLGVIATNGRVNMVYTGNLNTSGTQLRTQRMRIAAGARVVGADAGPVLAAAIANTIEQTGSTFTVGGDINFNNNLGADGRRVFNGFMVEFDRIVDPATFTVADIELRYNSTTADPALGGEDISAALTSVVPLDFYEDPASGRSYGSKRFLVNLADQTRVGTYSYSIGSDISDRIREQPLGFVNVGARETYNSAGAQNNVPIIDAQGNAFFPVTSTINVPNGAPNRVIGDLTVRVDIAHPDVSQLDIEIESPDGLVIKLVNAGDAGEGADFDNTIFSDAATLTLDDDVPPYAGTFRPAATLTQYFSNSFNGTWILRVTDQEQVLTGTLVSWGISFQPVSLQPLPTVLGNLRDQDGDGVENEGVDDTFAVPNPVNGIPFELPYVSGSLPIIVPGPRVVETQVSTVDPGDDTLDNVVVDRNVSAIDIQFDRDIDAGTFGPADILRITGPLGDVNLTGVTVTPIDGLGGDPTANVTDTFRVSFASQSLAGSYTLQLGSQIADTEGNLMDRDSDAGVALWTGGDVGTPLQTKTFDGDSDANGNLNSPVSVPANSTVNVNLNVPEAYLIKQVIANLSIQHPLINELEVSLFSPDGTEVLLFLDTPLSGATANMINTTFLDDATFAGQPVFPIQNGSAPFSGFYNPIQPLAQANGGSTEGNWRLQVKNFSDVNASVTRFRLSLTGNQIGTGLGEAIPDRTAVGFRIHRAGGGTEPGRDNWVPYGPAGHDVVDPQADPFNPRVTEETAGRVGAIAVDPSDPSGNTVYAAGASGGLWRTTNFLTRDAIGPLWVPLTDFGPTNAINIGAIALYPSADRDPAKTTIVVGTGSEPLNRLEEEEMVGNARLRFDGVGFLLSENAGVTWQVLDSLDNYDTTNQKYRPVVDLDPVTQLDRRDHRFVGAVVNKIVFEKQLDVTSGRPIIYAAVGQGTAEDGVAGLYRSQDGGRTWKLIRAGEATDFAIAEGSVRLNSFNRPTLAFAAFEGEGMVRTVQLNSPDPVFTLMLGGVGRPTINDGTITVNAPADTPNGQKSRISIAVPALIPGDPLADSYYQRWVYALVSDENGQMNGLYQSKDAGDNWTRVVFAPDDDSTFFTFLGGEHSASIALDPNDPNIAYIGSDVLWRVDTTFSVDPYNLSMYQHNNADGGVNRNLTTGGVVNSNDNVSGGGLTTLDSINPNTGQDSLTPRSDRFNATTIVPPPDPTVPPPYIVPPQQNSITRANRPLYNHLNLVRQPYQPFATDTSLDLGTAIDLVTEEESDITTFTNVGGFNPDSAFSGLQNPGADRNGKDIYVTIARIGRFNNGPGEFSEGFIDTGGLLNYNWVSSLVSIVDPLTGRGRILMGTDEGIQSFVNVEDGTLNEVVGFDQRGVNLTGPLSNNPLTPINEGAQQRNLQIDGSLNGNLQIARLFSGDAQPSLLAASVAQSLTVAAARRQFDVPTSDANLIDSGNITHGDTGRYGRANYVQTDSTGTGLVYILRRINEMPLAPTLNFEQQARVDFFQVQAQGGLPISRTNGLFQNNADANGSGQWDNSVRNFAVNIIDPQAIIMGSNAGRLFRTLDQGLFWDVIADPEDLDGSYTSALAFASPETETSTLNNHIYAGTEDGSVFVTRDGGGVAGTWTDISTGLEDAGAILKIIPNPSRGTADSPAPGLFEAYLVAENGVYYMEDYTAAGATWENITTNIPELTHRAFQLGEDWETPLTPGFTNAAQGIDTPELLTIAVDWRATHATNGARRPTLYAGGDAGVFRGVYDPTGNVVWDRFTRGVGEGTDGGVMPMVKVTDLDLALGNVDPNTGETVVVGSVDLLLATTLGRGQFGLAVGKPIGLSGPRIVEAEPTGPQFTPPTFIEVEFDVFMSPQSFTTDDVVIRDPSGQIIPATDVQLIANPGPGIDLNNRFRITFPALTSDGTYTFTIGPDITDGGGTLMNQDNDTINGEPTEDQFVLKLTVGVSDLADYVRDVYTELVGRAPTNEEFNAKKVKAIETARLKGLGVVLKELLQTFNSSEARYRLVERLVSQPGLVNEIGNFLPGYVLPQAEKDAFVLALQGATAPRKSPETITVELIATTDPTKDWYDRYFTVKSAGNVDQFLTNVYADLFPGLNINPLTMLTASKLADLRQKAQTPQGRNTIVKSLAVSNAAVDYDHDLNAGTARLRTSYRTHFVNLAYEKYVPNYTPSASELASARSVMGKALAKNSLQGSEWAIWKILSSKAYFEDQVQFDGLPDDGLRTNRAWVDAVIEDRAYRDSTDPERDTYSQKVLDTFGKQRTAFLKTVVNSQAYMDKEITEYFQLVHQRDPLVNPDEKKAARTKLKNGTTYASLIAARFATQEFFSDDAPGVSGLPEGPAAFAKAVYRRLFGADGTPAQEGDLASKAGSVNSRKAAVLAILNGQAYRELLVQQAFAELLIPGPSPTQLAIYAEYIRTRRWELLFVDMLGVGSGGSKPANPDTAVIPRIFWEEVQ